MDSISDSDYKFIQALSEEWMGSVFKDDKKYLFESRLGQMVKAFEFDSLSALIAELKLKKKFVPPKMKEYFIDIIIMTTHETLFFRDQSPFNCLSKVILPNLTQNKSLTHGIRIYSAACSTGQEPVSILTTLYEHLSEEWMDNVSILATDISKFAIDYAKEFTYSQLEIRRGFPIALLKKYFDKNQLKWSFKPELRKLILYQTENLCSPHFKGRPFDVNLCRNVTIYMDAPKVRKIYEHFHQNLHKDGYFIVGNSEILTNYNDLFTREKHAFGTVYRKKL